jgi:hypothetical protein
MQQDYQFLGNIELLKQTKGFFVSSLNFRGEQIFVQKGASVFSIEWYYLI